MFKIKIIELLILTILAVVSVGCSSQTISPKPTDFNYEGVEVFLSRASLTKTEFEHYKLFDTKIFAECGEIKQGRYLPRFSGANTIQSQDIDTIEEFVWPAFFSLQQKEVKFPSPGDNSSMFDPGRCEVTIAAKGGSFTITTSLDGISSPNSLAGVSVLNLIEQVKAAGRAICGGDSFYGIRTGKLKG